MKPVRGTACKVSVAGTKLTHVMARRTLLSKYSRVGTLRRVGVCDAPQQRQYRTSVSNIALQLLKFRCRR